MKAVDYFMLTSFGFIFAALIEYIIVLNTPNILLDCCVCFKKKEKDDTTQAEVNNVKYKWQKTEEEENQHKTKLGYKLENNLPVPGKANE